MRLSINTMPPSGAQLRLSPSDPSWIVCRHALVLTSQNLHVPSIDTDASSASLVGFHATCSMAAACPRSSVLYLTSAFSGFHTRSVLSAEPVAISEPRGFQAMVRILYSGQRTGRSGILAIEYDNRKIALHSRMCARSSR